MKTYVIVTNPTADDFCPSSKFQLNVGSLWSDIRVVAVSRTLVVPTDILDVILGIEKLGVLVEADVDRASMSTSEMWFPDRVSLTSEDFRAGRVRRVVELLSIEELAEPDVSRSTVDRQAREAVAIGQCLNEMSKRASSAEVLLSLAASATKSLVEAGVKLETECADLKRQVEKAAKLAERLKAQAGEDKARIEKSGGATTAVTVAPDDDKSESTTILDAEIAK